MRFLLDTHALLWWVDDDPRLSPEARRLIGDQVADAIGAPTAVSSPPPGPASKTLPGAHSPGHAALIRTGPAVPVAAPGPPQVCSNCGADMRLIAFITEAAPIERMRTHIGEPTRPPPITPARGPPAWHDPPESVLDSDLPKQPESDFELDQRIVW